MTIVVPTWPSTEVCHTHTDSDLEVLIAGGEEMACGLQTSDPEPQWSLWRQNPPTRQGSTLGMKQLLTLEPLLLFQVKSIFHLAMPEQPSEGFGALVKQDVVVSAGLVLLLEDGAPLRWSPAQHGVPLVKPVISICFLSFCIIYDSHFAITEHFWDKSHLIVMWFGFDLLVLCWEISYPCSLRIWICDSPFWRVISLVLECSDVGPMKSSLCSIFWNSLSIGVTSSSGTFCRVRQ